MTGFGMMNFGTGCTGVTLETIHRNLTLIKPFRIPPNKLMNPIFYEKCLFAFQIQPSHKAAKGLCIQTKIPLVLKECVAYSPINAYFGWGLSGCQAWRTDNIPRHAA
jgi:hypothetical protein